MTLVVSIIAVVCSETRSFQACSATFALLVAAPIVAHTAAARVVSGLGFKSDLGSRSKEIFAATAAAMRHPRPYRPCLGFRVKGTES